MRSIVVATVLAVLVVALAVTMGSSVARAEEFACSGSLGAVTVDNVRVPADATCTLRGTRVMGSIYLQRNSTLHANSVRVDGNIQTVEAAAQVNVNAGSHVGGSIQIKQSGGARVLGVDIDSDLQFEANTSPLEANGNSIGGNLQAFQNTGGVSVKNNTIDGNLQCKDNMPAPTGGGNLVHGSAEDQCAALVGTPVTTPTVQPTATGPASPTATPTVTPGTPIRADYSCVGSVGAVTVENLRVPASATCTLTGTRIQGNILVERDSTLHAYRVRVDGNVQTLAPAAQVNVYPGSFVGGSIQVKQSGSSSVQGVDIVGDLQFDTNRSVLVAGGNTIGGNLQAFQNRGGVFITGNIINGNLQCKQNVPAPIGGGNAVLGNAEDQCAALSGAHMVFMPRLLRPMPGQ